jgi:SAM-dependent methyltransferase
LTESMATIQADFDRIALLPDDGWNHNEHYHGFLLERMPPHCRETLEIGCGPGTFSRRLAQRSNRVLALDLSPQMIRIAKEHSQPYANIDFQIGDIMQWELPVEHFDCIASIATLHHLPMEEVLLKMSRSLKVGGILLVLDLFKAAGYADMLTRVIALPIDAVLRLCKNGRWRASRAEREAWAEHGRHEHYLPLAEIRQICARLLPGAQVQKHLFWRYSLVWRKRVV